MAISNLTGVPLAAAGDLGLLGSKPDPLDEMQLQRKKKLMSAAMGDQALSATQFLTGSGTAFNPLTVRSALGMTY